MLIYPVTVQGPSAAGEIAEAIDDINRRFTDIDVIITGRGGGSIEELWAFNEEKVARSIYKSSIPVISAVGHETDFTIADFVADRRAETPTAAADMAVPDTTELRDYINNLDKELSRSIRIRIQQAENSLNLMNPELFMRQLKSRTVMAQMKCDGIYQQLNSQMDSKLTDFTKRVELAGQVINSSNPDLILARGYAIVRNSQGKIVKNASEVSIPLDKSFFISINSSLTGPSKSVITTSRALEIFKPDLKALFIIIIALSKSPSIFFILI